MHDINHLLKDKYKYKPALAKAGLVVMVIGLVCRRRHQLTASPSVPLPLSPRTSQNFAPS